MSCTQTYSMMVSKPCARCWLVITNISLWDFVLSYCLCANTLLLAGNFFNLPLYVQNNIKQGADLKGSMKHPFW